MLCRPQTDGRVWCGNEYEQAYDVGHGPTVLGELLAGPTVQLEPWSAAQLLRVGAAAQPPENMVECAVATQEQPEHDPIPGPYVWWGALHVWGAALPSTLGFLSAAGRESVGQTAVLLAGQAGHAPTKEPLAVRTWAAQGGPRPRFGRLFTAMADMAMTPWVREEARELVDEKRDGFPCVVFMSILVSILG